MSFFIPLTPLECLLLNMSKNVLKLKVALIIEQITLFCVRKAYLDIKNYIWKKLCLIAIVSNQIIYHNYSFFICCFWNQFFGGY